MSEQRVRLLLGGAALVPLVDRIVQRVRRGRPLTGAVTLSTTDPEVRAAVAALVGRPIGAGASTSVRLDEVERIVRETGAAPDLLTAVTLLRGPVSVVADEEAAARARWERATAPLDRYASEHPDVAFLPELAGRLRAGGRSPTAAGGLVRDLIRVLDGLPARGQTLAAFSACQLDSAHALDRGPLRSLVEAVLDEYAARHEEPVDLDRWEMVGIAPDPAASTVLVHALRFDRSVPVGRALDEHRGPHLVTMGMLADGAVAVADEVFVCENPAVVAAAADRHGPASGPLVCVRGQPSAAAQRLLLQLARSGAVLRYHGDFDWGGIRIANRVMGATRARPWRFGTADLRAVDLPGAPLAGTRVEARWDPDLAAAIEARGTRLEEEQVLETLLADLAPSEQSPSRSRIGSQPSTR